MASGREAPTGLGAAEGRGGVVGSRAVLSIHGDVHMNVKMFSTGIFIRV